MKTSILQRKDFSQLLKNVGGNLSSLKQELTDYNTFTVAVADKDIKPQQFRNPYDIPRKNLLDQIARMRTNFLQTSFSSTKLLDTDEQHSAPIQQMGNYQEYLKKQPSPLRELENTPSRVHMFGNPFKVNKNIMVDEAEDSMLGQASKTNKRSLDSPPSSPGPRKRKPGPLPKDTPIRRPKTPPVQVKVEPPTPEPAKTEIKEEDIDIETFDEEDILIIKEEPEEIDQSEEPSENELTNHVPPVKNGRLSPKTPPIEETPSDIPNQTNKLSAKKEMNMNIWANNIRLRHQVCKELKKPGRSYEKLFSFLNKVQGTLDTKRAFIKDIIHEAGRFKKKVLIQLLEQFEQTLIQADKHSKTNSNNRANFAR